MFLFIPLHISAVFSNFAKYRKPAEWNLITKSLVKHVINVVISFQKPKHVNVELIKDRWRFNFKTVRSNLVRIGWAYKTHPLPWRSVTNVTVVPRRVTKSHKRITHGAGGNVTSFFWRL